MLDRDWILEQIYRAVDDVNAQLPRDQQIAKSEATVLIGDATALDSLAFLNLIVTTEEIISASLEMTVPLAAALMEDADRLPHTIAALADLIRERWDGHTHG